MEIVKASFNLRPEVVKQLKYIALMEGTTQTQILDDLLTKYIEAFEKKNGKIPLKSAK
jgi:predicted DNA-binding protein